MTHRRLAYFLPDAFDLVDPTFDFDKETRSKKRITNRHRHDRYAHELFPTPVYDGMLISKGVVDPINGSNGHYTLAQRERIERDGGRRFLRLTDRPIPIMGDCGAFNYINETYPPFTIDEVFQFYEQWDADYGLSVDHVITTYNAKVDHGDGSVDPDVRNRQEITLELASEFFSTHHAQNCRVRPLGVAQGWSPLSYADSVRALQNIGYTYIAIGGLVSLKTKDILTILQAVADVRQPNTHFHLLGVTRTDAMPQFPQYGVVSIDSTAPLRRAFKDDRENYYTPDPNRSYTAIRIPQIGGNPSLRKQIASGEISNDEARRLEQACLQAVKAYDADDESLDNTVEILRQYEQLHRPQGDMSKFYRDTLRDRPWRKCPCEVCTQLGYHVILFRGAERNRRRGFHNIWTFYNYHLTQSKTDRPIETTPLTSS
jgi:hypothetical protein